MAAVWAGARAELRSGWRRGIGLALLIGLTGSLTRHPEPLVVAGRPAPSRAPRHQMTAVLLRIRADLRSRWRAWIGLTLIAGLASGAVIAAAAGARRTDTSYSRFLRSSRAADVLVFHSTDPSFATVTPEDLATLPGVAATAPLVGYASTEPDVIVAASPDGRYGSVTAHQKLLDGRRPVRPDEVMVSFVVAEKRHLHVSSTLRLHLLPADDANAQAGPPIPLTMRVTGVEAGPGEFPPQTQQGFGFVWCSSALVRDNGGRLAEQHATAVRLEPRPGALASFTQETDRLGGGRPTAVYRFGDQAANTKRSIHLQAVTLWLLAGLLAVTTALVLTQLFVRQAFIEGRDNAALRSLGMERSQLWLVGMARAAFTGVAAALVAVVTAFALSPLTPVGIARIAEPRPGLAADATVLALGAVSTVVLALAAAAMAIGIPLGVAAGRWAWIVFAREIGIVPDPRVPVLFLLLLIPGTVVVANLVALVPGELAARLRPGRALRTE